jgi:hypothetical protein
MWMQLWRYSNSHREKAPIEAAKEQMREKEIETR